MRQFSCQFLNELFNHILSTGEYPEQWSKGIVIPVYKEGDDSDTGNCRPITLISHLAKLFTSVLKGCTAYCLNFSEFQKNQLLLQIFPKIDKRMKFPKVMFSVNVVVSFV